MTSRDLAGFVFRNRTHRRRTVGSTVGYLRDLFAWGGRCGEAWGELAAFLPKVKVVRNETLSYLWSPEEVRAVLAAIDRSSDNGKRDYAMILLVARLGQRTTDLRMLELSAIDWHAKTLTLAQHKTGRMLMLPLPDDVGWAIVDYLRNLISSSSRTIVLTALQTLSSCRPRRMHRLCWRAYRSRA